MNKSILKFKQGRKILTFSGGGKKKELKKPKVEPPKIFKLIPNWFTDISKRAAFNENPAVMTASGWTPKENGKTKLDSFNTKSRNKLGKNLAVIGASGVLGSALNAILPYILNGPKASLKTPNVPAVRNTSVSTSKVTPNVPAVRNTLSAVRQTIASNLGKGIGSKLLGILAGVSLLGAGTLLDLIQNKSSKQSSSNTTATPQIAVLTSLEEATKPAAANPTVIEPVITEPVIASILESTIETPSKAMSYVLLLIPTINFPELKTTPIDLNKEVVVKVLPLNIPYIPLILPQLLPEFEVGKYRDVNGLWDYMINNPNSREAMLFSNAFGNMITNKNREAFDRVMDLWGIRGRLGRKDSGTLRNLYELLKLIGSEGTIERENFIDASNNYEDYYNHTGRYSPTYKRGGLISNSPIQRFKNRKKF